MFWSLQSKKTVFLFSRCISFGGHPGEPCITSGFALLACHDPQPAGVISDSSDGDHRNTNCDTIPGDDSYCPVDTDLPALYFVSSRHSDQ